MNLEDGAWRTVNGHPVYIKDALPYYEGHAPEMQTSASGAEFTTEITPKNFQKRLERAKESCEPEERWRVDSGHTEEDYKSDTLVAAGKGSCVAVTPDGDIISLCRHSGDKGSVSGRKLLEIAKMFGGKKLDAYGRVLYDMYTRNGFEAISWTPFDKAYAPPGWDEHRDESEPVIFYYYTGNQMPISYDEFIMRVQASTDYDTAQAIRDKMVEERKNG